MNCTRIRDCLHWAPANRHKICHIPGFSYCALLLPFMGKTVTLSDRETTTLQDALLHHPGTSFCFSLGALKEYDKVLSN